MMKMGRKMGRKVLTVMVAAIMASGVALARVDVKVVKADVKVVKADVNSKVAAYVAVLAAKPVPKNKDKPTEAEKAKAKEWVVHKSHVHYAVLDALKPLLDAGKYDEALTIVDAKLEANPTVAPFVWTKQVVADAARKGNLKPLEKILPAVQTQWKKDGVLRGDRAFQILSLAVNKKLCGLETAKSLVTGYPFIFGLQPYRLRYMLAALPAKDRPELAACALANILPKDLDVVVADTKIAPGGTVLDYVIASVAKGQLDVKTAKPALQAVGKILMGQTASKDAKVKADAVAKLQVIITTLSGWKKLGLEDEE